jgi:hypothetical protein
MSQASEMAGAMASHGMAAAMMSHKRDDGGDAVK